MELRNLTINSLNKKLASGEVSAAEVCRAALERAEKLADLNAFITLTPERALERAADIDRLVEKGGPLPPLAGTVIAVKDNMVMTGIRTTAGSRILHNYRPP
ncbi:MAG TPA: amidase family protein, partial [Blastocatellia bacterium]|nr:amidase family protein [Blastocatellia bacterium]